jgi:hypothetical protein
LIAKGFLCHLIVLFIFWDYVDRQVLYKYLIVWLKMYSVFVVICDLVCCVFPCAFVVVFGMKAAQNNVFKIEWGLPEIAPKYRKQLAEIVEAYWVDQSNRADYQQQASTVYLNACKSDHVRFPKEAVVSGSTALIARNTGLDRRTIKNAVSHPEQLIFYDFKPYYIVSLGNDIYITDILDDFTRPYLKVDLPLAVRAREMILTLF